MFFEHIELVIPLGYPRPEVREAVGEIFGPTEERCGKQIDVCGSFTRDGKGGNEVVSVGDQSQMKHTVRRAHMFFLRAACAHTDCQSR